MHNCPDTPAKTKEQLDNISSNAAASRLIGVAGCAMGGVALIVGVVNACRGNYDWALLNGLAGGFSAFIGAWNIKNAKDMQHRIAELEHHYRYQMKCGYFSNNHQHQK